MPKSKLKPLSRQRLWQERQKEAGLCTRCPNKLAKNSVSQCEKCLKKARNRYKKRSA